MSNRNDGGPAFPAEGPSPGQFESTGMTLRDWFAGNASEADIADYMPTTVGESIEFEKANGFTPTRQWARYQHADAMIAARDRDGDA